jgi:hypothetical protein
VAIVWFVDRVVFVKFHADCHGWLESR